MDITKAIYDPLLKLQLPTPHGYVVTFWALGNWLAFLTSCNIPRSLATICDIFHCFPVANGIKMPTGYTGFNDFVVRLTISDLLNDCGDSFYDHHKNNSGYLVRL